MLQIAHDKGNSQTAKENAVSNNTCRLSLSRETFSIQCYCKITLFCLTNFLLN